MPAGGIFDGPLGVYAALEAAADVIRAVEDAGRERARFGPGRRRDGRAL